ncbi:MAG: hypothetical protein IJU99_04840 [Lachnospiraceae bacterium]|nr:hypothetical protein [Lachnospiraceae bacterium]MBR0152432.1 hypothetical protein [Lachnospiraceae bacterium]
MRHLKLWIRKFWLDEEGIGVVEIILILVILVGLVVIFKDEVTDIVEKAFRSITGGARDIIGALPPRLIG